MKTLAIILAVTATALIASSFMESNVHASDPEWMAWKMQYGKAYGVNSEEKYRYTVFQDNKQTVAELNEKETQATFGMTQFSDLTHSEFSTMFKGFNAPSFNLEAAQPLKLEGDLPDEMDWRSKNRVTEVKNQGQCGSCWAFSTVGSVEAAHAEKTGDLQQYSEQELVDCSSDMGDSGCNGGLMQGGLAYVAREGLEKEGDYSYTGKQSGCKRVASKSDQSVTKGTITPIHDEDSLLEWVGKKGPASVGVCANLAWQFYFIGDMYSIFCKGQVDHGVLAVGYTKDHWIVKNSWGPMWGHSGYIYLKRGTNTCSVATQAVGYSLV